MKKVSALRARELSWLARLKYLDAICVFFWASTPVLVSMSTFSTVILRNGNLTSSSVFTSLALFQILINPLNSFPWVLNGFLEARVSLSRIQKFLFQGDIEINQRGQDSDIQSGVDYDIFLEHCVVPISAEKKLNVATMKVKPGELVVIFGSVGSGKSSLLFSLLGETPIEGRKYFGAHSALVSQDPCT